MKIKFNKEVAIGITTFLRNASLYKLIESICEYLPDIKMYIVDQNISTKFKKALYEGLKTQGHVIKSIEYDCGISNARKILKNLVKEPFIAWMQDDFTITPKTNLMNMVNILKSNPKLGVVGGRIEGSPIAGSYSYYFLRWGDGLFYLPVSHCLEKGIIQWQKTPEGLSYVPADIVSEFTVWKKEVPNIFDEKVKVIEHSHVYLLLKYNTKWQVAYTPDSEIIHWHDRNEPAYTKFRSRKEDIDYIQKYWNITEWVKFDVNKYKFLLEHINYHIPITNNRILKNESIPLIPKDSLKEKIEKDNQTLQTLSTDITISPSLNMINAEIYDIFNEFISIMNNFDKNCFLREQTCWEAVVKHSIITSPLYISIPKLNQYELQCLINKGFNYIESNNTFTKNNYSIIVDYKLPQNFKIVTVENGKYLVPFPVHPYLKRLYGQDWKELGNKNGN